MEMALAATNEDERLSWIRVALAWQNLTHMRQVDLCESARRASGSASDAARAVSR